MKIDVNDYAEVSLNGTNESFTVFIESQRFSVAVRCHGDGTVVIEDTDENSMTVVKRGMLTGEVCV